MQITRSELDTQKGPADWFSGDVYIDHVAAPSRDQPCRRGTRPLHPRRPNRLAHAPARPYEFGWRGPRADRGRGDRVDPERRTRRLARRSRWSGTHRHPVLRVGVPAAGRDLAAPTARYAIARLHAELEGTPQPPRRSRSSACRPPRSPMSKPTHLAAAAAAVAVVSFASALVGQFGGPIKHTFDASDTAFSIALAITRIGALIAFIGIALADRRGRRLSILIGVAGSAIVCGVSAFSPTLAFFTGAQVFQRAFLISTATVADSCGRRGSARGRQRVRNVDARARGRLRVLDLRGRCCRSPTSASRRGAFRSCSARSRSCSRSGDRPAAGRDDALRSACARTDIDRGRVRDIRDRGYGRRFVLLAAIVLLLNVFSAPSSQLTNKYLTDVHTSRTAASRCSAR